MDFARFRKLVGNKVRKTRWLRGLAQLDVAADVITPRLLRSWNADRVIRDSRRYTNWRQSSKLPCAISLKSAGKSLSKSRCAKFRSVPELVGVRDNVFVDGRAPNAIAAVHHQDNDWPP